MKTTRHRLKAAAILLALAQMASSCAPWLQAQADRRETQQLQKQYKQNQATLGGLALRMDSLVKLIDQGQATDLDGLSRAYRVVLVAASNEVRGVGTELDAFSYLQKSHQMDSLVSFYQQEASQFETTITLVHQTEAGDQSQVLANGQEIAQGLDLRKITVEGQSTTLFGSGEFELSPAGKAAIEQYALTVARTAAKIPSQTHSGLSLELLCVGHADPSQPSAELSQKIMDRLGLKPQDLPAQQVEAPENRAFLNQQLSLLRARAVMRHLQEQLRAQGFAPEQCGLGEALGKGEELPAGVGHEAGNERRRVCVFSVTLIPDQP